MKIMMVVTAVFLMVFSACAGSDESKEASFISFGAPEEQSKDSLTTHWQQLDDKRRREIETFLGTRLGLSSTGIIRLIGVYKEAAEKGGGVKTLFHFQQLDLMGSRLFWSVLVDPDSASALVLYHVDARLITREPMPLANAGR